MFLHFFNDPKVVMGSMSDMVVDMRQMRDRSLRSW